MHVSFYVYIKYKMLIEVLLSVCSANGFIRSFVIVHAQVLEHLLTGHVEFKRHKSEKNSENCS